MEESFEDYKICQDGSHLELQAESEILFSSIYNIGASLSESSSISNSMVASTTFSHLHSEKFIDGSTVNDVWSAVKRYHWNLIGADSALLLYNALRKQQQKRVERVSASVSALLRATVKAFAHEQFRVWEDAADMLEAVGTNATLINSTTLSNSGAIDSAYEIIENYTELGGPSEKATSDWQNYSEVEQHDETAQQTKTAYESSPSGNFDVPRTISQSSCDSEKQVDRNESIDESQKEDNFSSFQVPFALFDVLSYTVIHSSERIDFGNNPVGVPNVMNKELNSWERQGVMITYNRVMHIVEVTGTVEDPKFEPGSISLSISLRDVSVSPVFIPKDGFRDAFEVKFLKAKPSMSLRSSTDPIVSIIFVGRDSETVRHFMAVIANPFVQLDVDPPDFEEEIREEYVEKADERVVLL